MFYDRFVYLCNQKGVSPSRAAIDAGISKSLVTKWKNNNAKDPSPDVIRKLSKYFNIAVSELLGEETEKAPSENGKRRFHRPRRKSPDNHPAARIKNFRPRRRHLHRLRRRTFEWLRRYAVHSM